MSAVRIQLSDYCMLCGHERDYERCGVGFFGGLYLCHADDHSCYHRWTVYGERPENQETPTNTLLREQRERWDERQETPHDHTEYVEGCFRCDLSRQETPERCPTCGSLHTSCCRPVTEAGPCTDPWHQETKTT